MSGVVRLIVISGKVKSAKGPWLNMDALVIGGNYMSPTEIELKFDLAQVSLVNNFPTALKVRVDELGRPHPDYEDDAETELIDLTAVSEIKPESPSFFAAANYFNELAGHAAISVVCLESPDGSLRVAEVESCISADLASELSSLMRTRVGGLSLAKSSLTSRQKKKLAAISFPSSPFREVSRGKAVAKIPVEIVDKIKAYDLPMFDAACDVVANGFSWLSDRLSSDEAYTSLLKSGFAPAFFSSIFKTVNKTTSQKQEEINRLESTGQVVYRDSESRDLDAFLTLNLRREIQRRFDGDLVNLVSKIQKECSIPGAGDISRSLVLALSGKNASEGNSSRKINRAALQLLKGADLFFYVHSCLGTQENVVLDYSKSALGLPIFHPARASYLINGGLRNIESSGHSCYPAVPSPEFRGRLTSSFASYFGAPQPNLIDRLRHFIAYRHLEYFDLPLTETTLDGLRSVFVDDETQDVEAQYNILKDIFGFSHHEAMPLGVILRVPSDKGVAGAGRFISTSDPAKLAELTLAYAGLVTLNPNVPDVIEFAYTSSPAISAETVRHHKHGASLIRTITRKNEDHIAKFIGKMMLANEVAKANPLFSEAEIQRIIDVSGLEGEQVDAFKALINSSLSLLKGLPGSGKTYSAKTLLNAYKAKGFEIIGVAPTGQAAENLSASLGVDCCTINSHISSFCAGLDIPEDVHIDAFFSCDEDEWAPGKGKIRRLFVADEAAMNSSSLFANLLKTFEPGDRVLLMGDHNQLGPIDCGAPFYDLLRSGLVPVAELTRNRRAAPESAGISDAIISLARNEIPVASPSRGFEMIRTANDQETLDLVKSLFAKYSDSAVMTPFSSGNIFASTVSLTPMLHEIRNPNPSMRWGEIDIKQGDVLRWTKNTYKKDYSIYNGTLLDVVAQGTAPMPHVTLRAKTLKNKAGSLVELTFTPDKLKELNVMHVLAQTVHAAQGASIPVVIVPLLRHESHQRSWNFEMFYVAMSRGKFRVVIVGDIDLIPSLMKKRDVPNRISYLSGALVTQDGNAARPLSAKELLTRPASMGFFESVDMKMPPVILPPDLDLSSLQTSHPAVDPLRYQSAQPAPAAGGHSITPQTSPASAARPGISAPARPGAAPARPGQQSNTNGHTAIQPPGPPSRPGSVAAPPSRPTAAPGRPVIAQTPSTVEQGPISAPSRPGAPPRPGGAQQPARPDVKPELTQPEQGQGHVQQQAAAITINPPRPALSRPGGILNRPSEASSGSASNARSLFRHQTNTDYVPDYGYDHDGGIDSPGLE